MVLEQQIPLSLAKVTAMMVHEVKSKGIHEQRCLVDAWQRSVLVFVPRNIIYEQQNIVTLGIKLFNSACR